ncbi:MAG: hypothetical protein ACXWUF_10985 [Methylomagnum sp.]
MQWQDIKTKYPTQFILLGNLIEKRLSESKSQIIAGDILQVSDDPRVIREAYRLRKSAGQNVLFTIPSTPAELIVENIPMKGMLR